MPDLVAARRSCRVLAARHRTGPRLADRGPVSFGRSDGRYAGAVGDTRVNSKHGGAGTRWPPTDQPRVAVEKVIRILEDLTFKQRTEEPDKFLMLRLARTHLSSYRSQFNEIIQRSSYQDLVRRIEQKLASAPSPGTPGPRSPVPGK